MSFTGFSEDDIQKLKNNENIKTVNDKENVQKTPATFKKGNLKNGATRNKSDVKIQQILHNKNHVSAVVPETALLNNTKDLKPDENVLKDVEQLKQDISDHDHEKSSVASQMEKKVNLDEFQARQKLMEEQNRKRKELLAKALADRTKQTQEEAERLSSIQTEFKKLDAILSNDVKILREQIETASLEYMEAQKRYHRIEKEFLDAKLLLHQKLERKEMLTEHLCAIIEKNEERKADKLMELLQKLNVNAQITKEGENDSNKIEFVQSTKISSTSDTSNL